MATYSIRDLGRREILIMSAVAELACPSRPSLPLLKPPCSERRTKYSDPFIRSQSCLSWAISDSTCSSAIGRGTRCTSLSRTGLRIGGRDAMPLRNGR